MERRCCGYASAAVTLTDGPLRNTWNHLWSSELYLQACSHLLREVNQYLKNQIVYCCTEQDRQAFNERSQLSCKRRQYAHMRLRCDAAAPEGVLNNAASFSALCLLPGKALAYGLALMVE